MDPNQVTMKAIIIGDSGTGKSSLLHRFVENSYTEDHSQTIGVEFAQKVITVMNKKVKLQVWDTAGQERYRSVTRSYYRGASACILCYDTARMESFLHITEWLQDATSLADKDVVMTLVGTKSDLKKKREVTVAEAAAFAQQHGMGHLETSAALGENVEEAFLTTVKAVLARGVDPGANAAKNGKPAPGARQAASERKSTDKGCAC